MFNKNNILNTQSLVIGTGIFAESQWQFLDCQVGNRGQKKLLIKPKFIVLG